MPDYFQNLDPASQPVDPNAPIRLTYDPNAALSLNPMSRPVVSHPDPATLDAGLQHLAELGIQVGLPLGLGALGGPLSMGIRTLGPALTQAILGPLEKPRNDGLLMGVVTPPNPEEAELSAAQVLAAAAGKKKLSYAQWQEKNPGAETGMFDFKGAQPAVPGSDAQVARYDPPRGVSDRVSDALKDPQVGKVLRAAVQKGVNMMPESWYRTGPLYDLNPAHSLP